MVGKFHWRKFSDCNLSDSFFDSLRNDYPGFDKWFTNKSAEGKEAFVFDNDQGIGVFLYLKPECESIEMVDRNLPAQKRLKIGTLKIDDRYQGQRIGEGAVGVALWRWQAEKCDEVYVTVFEKHKLLINLLKRFGFICIGIKKETEECVYSKSRSNLNFLDAYTAFPFISGDFEKAGIIPLDDKYHDKLFLFSELQGNMLEVEEEIAGNGITKVFIGSPNNNKYFIREPVVIYRIYRQTINGRTYRSVVTSFCVITKVEIIKQNGREMQSLDVFIRNAGNKTIFSMKELTDLYRNKSNLIMLEMTYNGAFGKGHNIPHAEMKSNGLWFDGHPYEYVYNKAQFIKILEFGDTDVKNVIIDKSGTY